MIKEAEGGKTEDRFTNPSMAKTAHLNNEQFSVKIIQLKRERDK
jgi:hypothetical protein